MNVQRCMRSLAMAAAAIALLAGNAAAQTGITVQLFQPPPNQLKIADLWRIRLINTSNTTYTVCLFGTLEETNLGKLLVDATTTRFRLPPGTMMVTGAEIQPIDANYYDDKYKTFFLRTGQAPSGEYRICVEVRVDCQPPEVARDCKDQRVQPTTPPILVAPPNESSVEDRLPAFSWLPPSPLKPGQSVRYQLKIVEVLGRQTPYDAMQSNPSWFERSNIATTVFQYPLSARQFTPSQRYAWMVKASASDFPMGESEIWWFSYAKPKTIGDDPNGFGRGDSSRVHLTNGRPTGTNTPQFGPITHTTLIDAPNGDVRFVFGDATKFDVVPGVMYDKSQLEKKQILEVLKELLRSCNE